MLIERPGRSRDIICHLEFFVIVNTIFVSFNFVGEVALNY